MKKFLVILVLLFPSLSFAGGYSGASVNGVKVQPLNILFFAIDDMGTSNLDGWGGPFEADIESDAEVYGSTLSYSELPNIGRFAASGVSYTQHRTNPLCAAARASLWSGLNSLNNGMSYHSAGSLQNYSGANATGGGTWVRLSEEAGYTTYGAGKFGVNDSDVVSPGRTTNNSVAFGMGFDEGQFQPIASTSLPANYGGSKTVHSSDTSSLVVVPSTDFWAQKDAEYIINKITTHSSSTPFLAYFGFNWPHLPPFGEGVPGVSFPPSSDFVEPCSTDANYYTKCFNNALRWIDYYVGYIFENIPDEKRKQTIVVIWSDNGSIDSYYGDPYPTHNAKGSVRDGGLLTPLIIGGPGVHITKRGTVFDKSVSVMDLGVTIASIGIQGMLSDTDLPNSGYDGSDLQSTFNHRTTPSTPPTELQILMLSTGSDQNSNRSSDASDLDDTKRGLAVVWTDPSTTTVWKVHRLEAGCALGSSGNTASECSDRLYNLTTDPKETLDVRSSNTSVYNSIVTLLTAKHPVASNPCVDAPLGEVWAEPIVDYTSTCGG